MQIFEAVELKGHPYMELKDVIEGEIVRDIIYDTNQNKVFLLVDHDSKRIWTYNGPQSPFKLQVYGGILATEMRKQLKLFYRVFSLNSIAKDSKEYIEILDKPIGGGRAKAIKKDDLPNLKKANIGPELSIHQHLNVKKAFETIDELPQPENFLRKFRIIADDIYTDEMIPESFMQEDTFNVVPKKMGRLNRGFTFFSDALYSTRLIVKDRKVQGIEVYIKKDDQKEPLELKIPIIFEEKFSPKGDVETIVNAFQIPDELPENGEPQE